MGYFSDMNIDTRTWEEVADDAVRDRLDGPLATPPAPPAAAPAAPAPGALTRPQSSVEAAPYAASLPRMDTLIAVALDGFAAEAQRLLDAELAQTPVDKDECRYFRAQMNAFTKALHYFSAGVRLTPTPSGYTIPSASRAGAVIHRLWRAGGIWHCSCEAGEKGIFHWHTALIAGYDRALDLIELEDDGDADGDDDPTPGPIVVSTSPSGLTLARGDDVYTAVGPASAAVLIGHLTGKTLGQRIAAARRDVWA